MSKVIRTCSQATLSNRVGDLGGVDKPNNMNINAAKASLQMSGDNYESEENKGEQDSKNVKVKRDATKRMHINNAPPIFTIHLKRFSQDACGHLSKEGEDDVKSSCPLCPGRHTCYNGRDKGSRSREGELTPKTRPQFGLQAATRLHEAGIASNRRSAIRR
ncbi:hypothetical protein RJ641_000730 [Dillenia turbinata]|uniref:Uncharacterized protein n=1 Tax=Dillenia turbinata TaxID=194707 RepID=A0AAN8WF68_9MAGN